MGNPAPEPHGDEWFAQLLDFSENNLPETERQHIEQHLKSCPTCVADLEGLQQTASMLRQLPEVQPGRSFALGETQVYKIRKENKLFGWSRTAAAVAAVFLVFFAGLDIAGVFSTPTQVATAVVPATPSPTLPSVGTVQPGTGTGAIQGAGGVSVNPATAQLPASVPATATKAATEVPISVRLLEVGLLISLVMFTVFAFALRPRAPGQKKLL